MRYYLKKLYPCDAISHMMTMTAPSYGHTPQQVDDGDMDVEGDRVTEARPPRAYRQLAFSYSANDIFWRDKNRLITSHQAFVSELLKRAPDQVHFGALQLMDDGGHETVQRQELVFDIDVTDYTRYCACGSRFTTGDPLDGAPRTCQSGQRHTFYCQCTKSGTACSTCWLHIEGAATLLHFILVHQLGIAEKHLLWVLSGKKGIHCLVNDPLYTGMTLEQRTRLFTLLQRDTPNNLKSFGLAMIHNYHTSTEQWEEQFVENVVCRRHMLCNDVFVQDCLDIVRTHYPSLHHQLEQRWVPKSDTHGTINGAAGPTSLSKWQSLKMLEHGQFHDQCPPSLLLILHYYYPRIDRGPLCTRNHLIKLPFSVHRSTRNIALPVERRHITERHGLPTQSLTLDDAIQHHHKYKTAPPDYAAAIHIFEQWIATGTL